ncbi:MAG: C1 family peptidase [Desulfobaccales bacterium]
MKRTVFNKAWLAGLAVIFSLIAFNALAFGSELSDIKKAIKEKKAKWEAGETSVSVLPDHLRQYRAKMDKPKVLDTDTFISAEPFLTGLASSLDWRNNDGLNYVSPVRDQGNCASCWAFATTAALESYFMIQEKVPGSGEDLAEQILVSCAGIGSCSGGDIRNASNFIRDTGLPPEMDYSYTATNGTCDSATSGWEQSSYRIGAWSYVCVSPSVDAIKGALVTYGPLVTTMNVFSDFFSYVSGIYSYVSGSYAGAHAVLIVGYDDIDQCFVVKNSWGTGWGEGGFFKIAYSQCNSSVNFGLYSLAYSPQAACSYGISPTSQSFTDAGGAASINVTARTDCSWNAVSNNDWITISQVTASSGNGTVYYSVAPNPAPGTVRKGSITAAGQAFAVSQGTAAAPTKKVPPGKKK